MASPLVLAALAPGLAVAAGRLVRAWHAERDEVDALVAAGAWDAIRSCAGATVAFPATAIVDAAWDSARPELRRRARWAARLAVLGDADVVGSDEPVVEARVDAGRVLRGALTERTVPAEASAVAAPDD